MATAISCPKAAFRDQYTAFRERWSRIRPEYARYPQVMRFVLSYDMTPVPASHAAHENNPLFMAFMLYAGARIAPQHLDEAAYLDLLIRSYAVDDAALYRGITYALEHGEANVVNSMVASIERHIAQAERGEPNRREVAVNILLPYLTFVAHGLALDDKIERAIARVFRRAFGGKKELTTFVRAFRDYLDGAPFHVRRVQALNMRLAAHRLRVYVSEGHCSVFHIMKDRLHINAGRIGDVLLLRRIGPSLLPSHLGGSQVGERNVTVVEDTVLRRAASIQMLLDLDRPVFWFTEHADQAWRELGLDLDNRRAQKILAGLARQSFPSSEREVIADQIRRAIIVNNLKSKWDEGQPGADKANLMDARLSACLAEILFADVPAQSLGRLVLTMQELYIDLSDRTSLPQLNALVCLLWNLATRAADGELPAAQLRAKARELYNNHVCYHGGRLPRLEAFERTVIEPQANAIASFRGMR